MQFYGRFGRALLLVAAIACLPIGTAGGAEPVRPVLIESLSGKAIEPLRLDEGVRAAVFVFVSVDCPVSNRYAPEVKRLHDTFVGQGVRFTLVYPNPAEAAPAIREHLKAYSYPIDALRDPRQAFVKHAGISITPEAVPEPRSITSTRDRLQGRHRLTAGLRLRRDTRRANRPGRPPLT